MFAMATRRSFIAKFIRSTFVRIVWGGTMISVPARTRPAPAAPAPKRQRAFPRLAASSLADPLAYAGASPPCRIGPTL